MVVKNSWIELDKVLSILAVIVIPLLIAYLCKNFYHNFSAIVSLLFAFTACFIWLAIRKKASLEDIKLPKNHSTYIALNILFFVFLILSIISIHFRPDIDERPLIYFVFIALMAGIVAIEIFISPQKQKHRGFILFQIIVIGLISSWSQQIIFPTLVGVDPWANQSWVLEIINTSHIPDFCYAKIPFFYLLLVCSELITGLSFKLAMMLSVSLVQIVCNAIFVYLIGIFILKNNEIGLLGALLLITSNYHILMSFWPIANALAVVFILIIIYLLLMKTKNDNPVIVTALSIFLMIALVLTHTIMALAMSIILFIMWTVFGIHKGIQSYKGVTPVTLGILVFFAVFMFAWWTYASGTITTFAQLLSWGFKAGLANFPTLAPELAGTVPLTETLYNQLGLLLFMGISCVGLLYMISNRGNRFTSVLAVTGIAITALTFFSPMLGRMIFPVRWRYLLMVLLAISSAIPIMLIYKMKNKKVATMCSFLSISFLTFVMVTSFTANIDNNYFSPNTGFRFALTESELTAIQTTQGMWNGGIGVDKHYASANLLKESNNAKGNKYLFRWEKVPGTDSTRLLRELRRDFAVGWVEDAEIRKLDDCKTVHISKGDNSVEITIAENEEKATLVTSDGRTYDLEVRKEEDMRYTYIYYSIGPLMETICTELSSGEFENSNDRLILIREEIVNSTVKIFRSVNKLDYDPKQVLIEQGQSRIYDCGTVSGFVKV